MIEFWETGINTYLELYLALLFLIQWFFPGTGYHSSYTEPYFGLDLIQLQLKACFPSAYRCLFCYLLYYRAHLRIVDCNEASFSLSVDVNTIRAYGMVCTCQVGH